MRRRKRKPLSARERGKEGKFLAAVKCGGGKAKKRTPPLFFRKGKGKGRKIFGGGKMRRGKAKKENPLSTRERGQGFTYFVLLKMLSPSVSGV